MTKPRLFAAEIGIEPIAVVRRIVAGVGASVGAKSGAPQTITVSLAKVK